MFFDEHQLSHVFPWHPLTSCFGISGIATIGSFANCVAWPNRLAGWCLTQEPWRRNNEYKDQYYLGTFHGMVWCYVMICYDANSLNQSLTSNWQRSHFSWPILQNLLTIVKLERWNNMLADGSCLLRPKQPHIFLDRLIPHHPPPSPTWIMLTLLEHNN